MPKKISDGIKTISGYLSREKKKTILFLLFVFLLMRMATALFLGQKNFEGYDSIVYDQYACTIVKDARWLADTDFEGNYRAPGYPLFIAAVYSLFGCQNHTAVYIFQALLSVLTCFYIYKLSRLIFDEQVAFLSFVWSGLYVFYFYYMRFLLRETLIFSLIIVFFYYLYIYILQEKNRTKNFWFFSVAYVCLIHTDARYLFYLPFFFFLFLCYRPFFRAVKQYVVFLAVFSLLLIPWTIRNYIAYDGFVLINTRTLDLRPKDIRSPKPFSRISDHILNFKTVKETERSVYPTEEERELIKQGFNPNNRTAEEIAVIKKDIYPASGFLERKWFWFVEFWRPVRLSSYYYPFPDAKFHPKWTWPHNLSSLVCYGLLLPFMLIGIFLLWKQKNRAFFFLLFPILLQTFLHVLHCGLWRYRVPIDGFIIMIAFYGIVQTLTVIRKKSRAGF
ncbi:MAG: glycosyltransferase family 39 protein [Candidatus Aminicenantes bacterium]|nr:glycosyltransferase family 39 protein [Candidatus Aminicenantes bacterium]